MTIPTQIAPYGAIGAAFPTTDPSFSPSGKDLLLAAIPQLSWVDTGASQYSIQVGDCTGTAPAVTVNRADVLGPDGVCRYAPAGKMASYATAGWFVWEGAVFPPPPGSYAGPMLFVLNRAGFPTGDLGSKGRVVDFSTSRGHSMWPREQWITVPAADLVVPGVDHAFARVQIIAGNGGGLPCIGFKLRRDSTCPDPEPIGGMPYTCAPVSGDTGRAEGLAMVELAADGSFQFQWNDRFNGNGPSGTLSSAAISLTM